MPPAQKRRRSQAEITAEAVAAAVATAVAAEKVLTAEAVAAAVAIAQTTAAAQTAAASTAAANAAAATTTAAATATAAANAATREQNWLCGVCKDLCDKPTSTTCGHTFCLVCIKAAIAVKEECPNCRAKVSRTSPLAVNIPIQEFIAENAGPLFVARKAEKTETFLKALVDLNPDAAIDALSTDVELRRFVGDASLMMTPLLWACKNANDDDDDLVDEWNNLIKALLTTGADVNAHDSEGKSALFLAASCGNLFTWITAIPALLDRGARDPSALEEIVLYATIYNTAEYINAIDIVLLRMAEDSSYSNLTQTQKRADLANMLRNGYDRTAVALFDQNVRLKVPHKMLLLASAGGCSFFIRKLIAAKVVSVNFVIKDTNQTALHIACSYGQENSALALLECGASKFGLDDFNRRPLDYAQKNEMAKVVEALEAKGCKD